LKGSNEPKLKLRGIEYEQVTSADGNDAETELKLFAQSHAGRVINLQSLPFTQDRDELFDELKAASVCIMPSWHEGFGLVAWEAIAAGVPLIVAVKSGVYKFLSD
jgi:glycosyltransferase involved in cell wall biosynthesis